MVLIEPDPLEQDFPLHRHERISGDSRMKYSEHGEPLLRETLSAEHLVSDHGNFQQTDSRLRGDVRRTNP